MSLNFVQIPKPVAVNRKPALPLSRVELHVHLDGCIRKDTVWELQMKKQLSGADDQSTVQSYRDLKNAINIAEPENLGHFLSKFAHFAPSFTGDLNGKVI